MPRLRTTLISVRRSLLVEWARPISIQGGPVLHILSSYFRCPFIHYRRARTDLITTQEYSIQHRLESLVCSAGSGSAPDLPDNHKIFD